MYFLELILPEIQNFFPNFTILFVFLGVVIIPLNTPCCKTLFTLEYSYYYLQNKCVRSSFYNNGCKNDNKMAFSHQRRESIYFPDATHPAKTTFLATNSEK